MKKETCQVAASMLGSKLAYLGEELQQVVTAGVDRIHWDLMDYHFVPNLGFSPTAIQACREITDREFDVHLMVENPLDLIPMVAAAGANTIIIHPEAMENLPHAIHTIHTLGKKSGVAVSPQVKLEDLNFTPLTNVDVILVMGVHPGFGGQEFISSQLQTIKRAREIFGGEVSIHVDGGVSKYNAKDLCKAGADVLVAGTAIFSQPDYAQAIQQLRENPS